PPSPRRPVRRLPPRSRRRTRTSRACRRRNGSVQDRRQGPSSSLGMEALCFSALPCTQGRGDQKADLLQMLVEEVEHRLLRPLRVLALEPVAGALERQKLDLHLSGLQPLVDPRRLLVVAVLAVGPVDYQRRAGGGGE